jgi:hypothetical protein
MAWRSPIFLLLAVAACGGFGVGERADDWCVENLVWVRTAAAEYVPGVDRLQMDIPADVQAAFDREAPRSEQAKGWKAADRSGWDRYCGKAYRALGQLTDANLVWCVQNGHQVGDTAWTMGMDELLAPEVRARVDVLGGGSTSLSWSLRLTDLEAWTRACRTAYEAR